jgi:hypothetical protein
VKGGGMNLADFKVGDRVVYIPVQAYRNYLHPDVEHGVVTSINDKFVFVKYFGKSDSVATPPDYLFKEQGTGKNEA